MISGSIKGYLRPNPIGRRAPASITQTGKRLRSNRKALSRIVEESAGAGIPPPASLAAV
jgi:hypothetical protein